MAAFNLERSKWQLSLTSGESPVDKTKKSQTVKSMQSKRECDRAHAKMRIQLISAWLSRGGDNSELQRV